MVDNIYKSANLEGIAVTFADIYSFMNIENLEYVAVLKVVNNYSQRNIFDYNVDYFESFKGYFILDNHATDLNG